MKNENFLTNLELPSVVPYISKEECDALFIKILELGKTDFDITEVIKYVSPQCLERVVTDYVNGKLEDVEMEILYPFFSETDIKRIYRFVVEKYETKDEI